MSSWNDSMHFCNWVGVTCNNNTARRVVILNLKAQQLSGSLPPSLGNLTYLTELNLGNNYFNGRIPQEFGRLLRLRHLNLNHSFFCGEIPENISRCTELIYLNFQWNELVGKIPDHFSTLTKLKAMGFGYNNLTGTIPSWIGNFSSMLMLSFTSNNFQGSIPSELGRLSRLRGFWVPGNNLTGTMPSSIYNITSLTRISLVQNRLQGNLPPNIGFTLPNLRFFLCGENNFRGPIPTSLVNISGLQALDLGGNGLTGMVPDNLGRLKDLERLNFEENRLGSGKVGDLYFINFLSNCTSLTNLGLAVNRFGGELPPSIGNLSIQLNGLTLGGNLLSGSIPTGIGNLVNLQALGMEDNNFHGSVPHIIGKLQNLKILGLHDNKLSQSIPSSIGNLSSLINLLVQNNRLEGRIPPSLGQCKSLRILDLSGNRLNGTIPKEVIGLSSLSIYLALHHNLLTGPLPYEVGRLFSLTMLDVSENKLSGIIPSSLGKCNSMGQLRLGGNKFEGTIPESLEALKGLDELNLSSNNFSGQIPKFLGTLRTLKHLDLSYNNFEGEVPKEGIFSNSTMVSIFGNKNLCGGLQELHLPPCPVTSTKKSLALKILIPIISALVFLVILVSILYACFKGNKSRRSSLTSSSSKDLLPQISYLELSRSTNGFSTDNLIGSGSFGCVYKGILPGDGSTVAIKVLNIQQQGASKSFISECKALAIIRHRNLLKIISSCSSIDEQGNEFKALIFDFMSNGNLDGWLHTENDVQNQGNSNRLSFIQRLNIAIDIANALDYLHNQCETPIVHCDLKPSNVLLDNDMVAHVGDFGLARIILEESNESSFEQTLSLALKGSIGYIPPEYGSGGIVSIKGDIYSYGILVLEMITGKRPTDDSFGDDSDIRQFITAAMPDHILDIVDPSLFFTEFDRQNEETQETAIMGRGHRDRREMEKRKMEECLVLIIEIGMSCSMISPGERMCMDVVVNELQRIRDSFLKLKNRRRMPYYHNATSD